MEVRQDYKEIDDGVKRMDVPSRWKGMSRSYFNSRSRGKNSVSMWRPKAKTMEGLSGVASSSFNLNGFEQKLCDHTTVMMKNLPNKFRFSLSLSIYLSLTMVVQTWVHTIGGIFMLYYW